MTTKQHQFAQAAGEAICVKCGCYAEHDEESYAPCAGTGVLRIIREISDEYWKSPEGQRQLELVCNCGWPTFPHLHIGEEKLNKFARECRASNESVGESTL